MKTESLLTRLDPRSKMLFTLFIVTSVLLLDISNSLFILFFIGFLLIMTLFSGFPFIFYIRKLLKIYPMIFLITFLLPFQSYAAQTDALFTINHFYIYKSGLMRFTAINLKYIVIILSTLILTTTTPFSRLIKGLESVRLPGWFLAILTFMSRLIFLLEEEIGKMHSAFKSRYISLPYFRKVKILAQMSGIYFVRIVERSERSYSAMISRGFSGQCPSSAELNWQCKDSLLTALGLIFIMIILTLH